MTLFDNAKNKVTELKAKWDDLPEDAKHTYIMLGVGGVAALYFYGVGYDWGWKCAKRHYQEELENILHGMNAKYLNVLNSSSTMDELLEAGKSGKLLYRFVDFLGRNAEIGLEYVGEPQEKHTA